MKRAIITGITGQDGSFLAEQLLEKGYEVHGLVRRSSSFNTERIDHLYRDPHEEQRAPAAAPRRPVASPRASCAWSTRSSPTRSTTSARSRTSASPSTCPEYTNDVTGMGTVRLLEAIRDARVEPRFYQASSSEMFGATPPPQGEATPFHPRSPYAVAKVSAYWITVNYRESYGMHASNGILFNHESERRGETFVTRKITRALAAIHLGLQDKLYLGNLDAKRDWGYAPDFTDAMWRIAPAGRARRLRDRHRRDALGARVPRRGRRSASGWTGSDVVEIDPKYYRPAEVDALCGDASKAREKLGWAPTVTFKELVRIMVESDVKALEDRLAGRGVRVGRELSPTPQFWDGKAVVVTGGAGFLGRAVVRDARRRSAPTRRSCARPTTTCAIRAPRARRSTARPSSSTSPPTSAGSASTAPTRRRSSTTT